MFGSHTTTRRRTVVVVMLGSSSSHHRHNTADRVPRGRHDPYCSAKPASNSYTWYTGPRSVAIAEDCTTPGTPTGAVECVLRSWAWWKWDGAADADDSGGGNTGIASVISESSRIVGI